MTQPNDITKKKDKKAPQPKPRCTAELTGATRLKLISAILAKGVLRLIESKKQAKSKEVKNVRKREKHGKAKRVA